MRRSLFRRLSLKLYSALARAETAARFIVWIVGMFLAVITVVTVLSLLSTVNRYIVLISLILFLLSGLVLFVRSIARLPLGERNPNADADKTLATEPAESNGAAETENRSVLIQQWQTVVHYWASDNSVVLRWSSIFIVVNSILFALLAITPSGSIVPVWTVTTVGPVLGILMNIVWFIIAARFVAYLKFYYELSRDIQRKVPILRFPDSPLLTFRWYQKMSTKKMLQLLPLLFAAVWVSLLILLNI